MLDDADKKSLQCAPPDAERVNRNYVETCRRLGFEPVSRDRAQGLIAEWSEAIAASRSVPPITH